MAHPRDPSPRLRSSCIMIIIILLAAPLRLPAQPDRALYVLEGPTRDAKLGAFVARVPDVTGDGVDELVSGEHRIDGPAGKDAGRVVLFDGATGKPLWKLEGEKAYGLLGHDVGGIRDVNGDGRGDVIASAYQFDLPYRPDCGKVYLLDGRTGKVIWTREGENASDEFGYALSDVPDLNGDGIDDVLVGAWLNDHGGYLAGRVYLYSGKTGTLLRTHDGRARQHRFGCAAAGFGDLDRDGHGDYAVGALQAGPQGEGQAYVFSGKTGSLLRTFTGERATDLFGISVAAIPDTDGDGLEDLLVGARDHDTGGTITDAGRAYLYSGRTGARLFVFDGEKSWDKFGRFGAGIPDMDGDGRGEVAIGAYYHHGNGVYRSGAAYVFSGRTGQRLFTFYGEEPSNMFGWALCGLNDVNGDGRGDLVVGAHQYRPNPTLTESYGRIYVYTQGLTASVSTISAAAGGTITLTLDAGRKHRLNPYMVVATVSGNHPGFVLGDLHVPINFDLFTIASWLYANTPILVHTYRRLDLRGRATAEFRAPPGFLKGYEGMTLTFAYALVFRMDMVSNPVPVRIKP